jgi:hypothetical protein
MGPKKYAKTAISAETNEENQISVPRQQYQLKQTKKIK